MGLGTMFKANKAYRAQKNGDEAEAMRLYEECFQEGLADPRYVLAYAVLMLRDGQYQKAKDFLVKHQKAPGMTPDQRVTLIVDYAACCYRLGDLDKAVRKMEELYRKRLPQYRAAADVVVRGESTPLKTAMTVIERLGLKKKTK